MCGCWAGVELPRSQFFFAAVGSFGLDAVICALFPQVHVPMEWRVKHTSAGYTHFRDDAGRPLLKSKLDHLRRLLGNKTVDRWFALIDSHPPGWEEEFCEDILREHYDPAYLHSFARDRIGGETVDVEVPDLEEATLDAFARDLMERFDPDGAAKLAGEGV